MSRGYNFIIGKNCGGFLASKVCSKPWAVFSSHERQLNAFDFVFESQKHRWVAHP